MILRAHVIRRSLVDAAELLASSRSRVSSGNGTFLSQLHTIAETRKRDRALCLRFVMTKMCKFRLTRFLRCILPELAKRIARHIYTS